MMKCTICGRRTLPGAKLCLPCRQALRRARDDTVSELMPLPTRLPAFAVPGSSTVSRTLDLMGARRTKRRSGKSTGEEGEKKNSARAYSPLRVAAIGLFVMAIGVVAFGFTEQLQGEPSSPEPHEPASLLSSHPSVSPAAMAAEARNTVLVSPTVLREATVEVDAPVAPPVEAKPRKSPSSGSRLVKKVEAPAITPVVVVQPVVTAAAAPMPAPAVAPDRWQLLSAALNRCGGNLFERIGCEHVARAKYCDGYWGQVSPCPGGISNDHGQ